MNSIIKFLTRNSYKNLFLFIIFVINSIQAYFTNFNTYYPHEAYYWVWAKHLSWGYYDHPPLVALFIKLGYFIIPNELGVRLPFVLLYVGFINILTKIISINNYKIFYAIVINLAALNLVGIFAIPDIPLIFFIALFFLFYKHFLVESSYKNSVLMGLAMALVMYSKYNGILVIAFVILSNLRLVCSYKFFLACLIGLILYFPHLLWQYQNGFPSIMFHLSERYNFYSPDGYSLGRTLSYIGTQILFYGPIGAILLFYYAFKTPTKDRFDRSLKFTLYGVLTFFLLYTYKTLVLPQWSIVIVVPLVVLAYSGAIYCKKFYKLLYFLAYISIGISLIIRIILITAPYSTNQNKWFLYPFKNFIELKKILKLSENLPVIFINDWKGPALYEFYTGKKSYSINNLYDRKNEYNYLLIEPEFWGKKVMIFEKKGTNNYLNDKPLGEVKEGKIKYNYYIRDNFYSFSMIQLIPIIRWLKTTANSNLDIKIKVNNLYNTTISDAQAKKTNIVYTISNRPLINTGISLYEALKTTNLIIKIKVPEQKGKYSLRYGLMYNNMPPTHNSEPVILEIK